MALSAEAVERALGECLAERGASLGLGEGPFVLEYVPNPGGFVNVSFKVTGPSGRWHCKLAGPEEIAGHRRAWELRSPLADRYHAPRLLAWIEVDRIGREGTIGQHFSGRTPSPARDTALWPAVHTMACDLHADRELAATLAALDRPRSCREYLAATWLAMLEADVAETRDHESAPPFVDRTFWEWALEEVDCIRTPAADDPAFDEPADAAVHGDLWAANVLVGGGGWRIVDWDDVGLGDPAKDIGDWWYAADGARPLLSPSVEARLPLWLRTRLLVDVVDPLADWTEATAAPEGVREEMRRGFRRMHEGALREYRARYAG